MRLLPRLRMQPGDPDTLEADVAERLEAFAARALDPDEGVVRRHRGKLMDRFIADKVGARPARESRPWRLATGAAALALLAISIATTAAVASGPGQPLYGLRLAFEQLTLPAQVPERALAQLDHLEQRLAEARQASDRGNGRGVVEALAAYQSQLEAAIGTNGQAPGLDVALQRHRHLLESLAPLAPPAAQAKVIDALVHVQGAIDAATTAPGAPAEPRASESPGRPEDTPGGRP